MRSISNIAAKLRISKVSNFPQRRKNENTRLVTLYSADVTDIGRIERIREDAQWKPILEL